MPVLPESISETIVRGRIEERDHQVGPFLIGQVRVVKIEWFERCSSEEMVRRMHNRCNEEVFKANMLVQAMLHHEPLKRFPAKEQESDKAGVLLHLKKMDHVDRDICLAIMVQHFLQPFRGNTEAA